MSQAPRATACLPPFIGCSSQCWPTTCAAPSEEIVYIERPALVFPRRTRELAGGGPAQPGSGGGGGTLTGCVVTGAGKIDTVTPELGPRCPAGFLVLSELKTQWPSGALQPSRMAGRHARGLRRRRWRSGRF